MPCVLISIPAIQVKFIINIKNFIYCAAQVNISIETVCATPIFRVIQTVSRTNTHTPIGLDSQDKEVM